MIELATALAGLGVGQVVSKSAVAVPHTGNTVETTLATITLPAGTMGPNGQLEIIPLWSSTGAGSKTFRVKFGGTTAISDTVTTTLSKQSYSRIANRNSASSQIMTPAATSNPFGTSGLAPLALAINTDAEVTILITGQLANAAEVITLESYLVRVIYGS